MTPITYESAEPVAHQLVLTRMRAPNAEKGMPAFLEHDRLSDHYVETAVFEAALEHWRTHIEGRTNTGYFIPPNDAAQAAERLRAYDALCDDAFSKRYEIEWILDSLDCAQETRILHIFAEDV